MVTGQVCNGLDASEFKNVYQDEIHLKKKKKTIYEILHESRYSITAILLDIFPMLRIVELIRSQMV